MESLCSDARSLLVISPISSPSARGGVPIGLALRNSTLIFDVAPDRLLSTLLLPVTTAAALTLPPTDTLPVPGDGPLACTGEWEDCGIETGSEIPRDAATVLKS